MIVVVHIGAHEARFTEPGVLYVRCHGDLTLSEVCELLLLAREHLSGRDGRLLLDAAQLGSLPSDSLHHIDGLRRELEAADCPHRQVALLRAHVAHKVLLLPLLCRQSDEPGARFSARFFQRQTEALAWLGLSAPTLFGSRDCIHVAPGEGHAAIPLSS